MDYQTSGLDSILLRMLVYEQISKLKMKIKYPMLPGDVYRQDIEVNV